MINVETALLNQRILVLGGSTREIIDGVRHYSNDGRNEAHGAKVTFISAKSPCIPTSESLQTINKIHGRKIISTDDLLNACAKQSGETYDVILQLANIPSIRAAEMFDRKLKVKNQDRATVSMTIVGNVDIRARLMMMFPSAVVAGYDTRQMWFGSPNSALVEAARSISDQHRETTRRPIEALVEPQRYVFQERETFQD
jgi:phosphopantothenoylcysteine synthetase/decarboxylase